MKNVLVSGKYAICVVLAIMAVFFAEISCAELNRWSYASANESLFGEMDASVCTGDEVNSQCLMLICTRGELRLDIYYTDMDYSGPPLQAALGVDGKIFEMKLESRQVRVDQGPSSTFYGAVIGNDDEIISALMNGRKASLATDRTKTIDFTLNGSASAISRLEKNCSISQSSRTSGVNPKKWDIGELLRDASGGKYTAAEGKTVDLCDELSSYRAELVDLNDDGRPEIFLSIDGTCMGGNTGTWFELYIKGRNGRWQREFGVTGSYQVKDSRHQGFADIEIGGAGLCFPVYRWNGTHYAIHKSCR